MWNMRLNNLGIIRFYFILFSYYYHFLFFLPFAQDFDYWKDNLFVES